MKKVFQLPYALLVLGVILTLLAAALTPASSALAFSAYPAGAAAGVPQPIEPIKVITDTTPTYRWTHVNGVSNYVLQVLKEYSATAVYTITVPAKSACYYNVCSYTPTQKLGRYGYRWHVKVSNTSNWSPLMTFYVRGVNFANHFTYNMMYTWKKKSGGEWYTIYKDPGVVGYLASDGLPNKCTAAVQTLSSAYDNFEAETRMKITGAPSAGKYPEAYMALRMKNSVNAATQCWYGGYLFGYSRDGKYSFWKMQQNGTWTPLISPKYSSLVNTIGWNNFKVTAIGNKFNLYINKKYIGTVTDSTYPIGYVGLEMVNHGSNPTKFYADWFTVKMLP